jgi:hypothetical protein
MPLRTKYTFIAFTIDEVYVRYQYEFVRGDRFVSLLGCSLGGQYECGDRIVETNKLISARKHSLSTGDF